MLWGGGTTALESGVGANRVQVGAGDGGQKEQGVAAHRLQPP